MRRGARPRIVAPGFAGGDVLTQSTALDGDVVCPGETQDPLTGVTIGANGITLDLNGFSIRGPNRGEQVGGLQAGVALRTAYTVP